MVSAVFSRVWSGGNTIRVLLRCQAVLVETDWEMFRQAQHDIVFKPKYLIVRKLFWSLLLAGVSCTAIAQAKIDNPKAVTFKIKNFGLMVEGSISALEGEIRFDSQNVATALFDVSVDANSIDTGISLRDNHLRKEEYLDVKNYPRIKFVSKRVVKGDKPNTWILTGELTIKKITKEISFPFSVLRQDENNNFKGEFSINRRDFGVGGKSISMADELLVMLNIKN